MEYNYTFIHHPDAAADGYAGRVPLPLRGYSFVLPWRGKTRTIIPHPPAQNKQEFLKFGIPAAGHYHWRTRETWSVTKASGVAGR